MSNFLIGWFVVLGLIVLFVTIVKINDMKSKRK